MDGVCLPWQCLINLAVFSQAQAFVYFCIWCFHLQELQLWQNWGSPEDWSVEPSRIPRKQCYTSFPGCYLEVDDTRKEASPFSTRCICWQMETYQEWHFGQEGTWIWHHHECSVWGSSLRQRRWWVNEQHCLSLPILSRPNGCWQRGSRVSWRA